MVVKLPDVSTKPCGTLELSRYPPAIWPLPLTANATVVVAPATLKTLYTPPWKVNDWFWGPAKANTPTVVPSANPNASDPFAPGKSAVTKRWGLPGPATTGAGARADSLVGLASAGVSSVAGRCNRSGVLF